MIELFIYILPIKIKLHKGPIKFIKIITFFEDNVEIKYFNIFYDRRMKDTLRSHFYCEVFSKFFIIMTVILKRSLEEDKTI